MTFPAGTKAMGNYFLFPPIAFFHKTPNSMVMSYRNDDLVCALELLREIADFTTKLQN
jgi:hypothetical protein